MSWLYRVIAIMAFGLISFWPDIGLAFQAINHFSSMPMTISVASAFWFLILFSIIPISLKWFQRGSTLCLTVIYLIALWASYQHGFISPAQGSLWVVWMVAFVSFIVAWYIISVPFYRTVHGVATVQINAPVEEIHDHNV